MDDTKFLIIVDKNDYEVSDWSVLDEVRDFLDSRGYQLKCRTDFEGMCKYCDGVRKILKDGDSKSLRELGE